MWGIHDGLAIVRRNERSGNYSYDDDEERDTRGMDLEPDTVTYNTVIAIVATAKNNDQKESPSSDNLILSLIDQMKDEGIARDAIMLTQSRWGVKQ
jgi:hypothetical protein